MKIKSVKGLQIFDSRGNPTVKAFVELSDGSVCFRSGCLRARLPGNSRLMSSGTAAKITTEKA